MKTSNYISISFLIFLFGGIFLLFLSSKFHEGTVSKQEFESFEENLDDFSVIVAGPNSNIGLRNGTQSKIVISFLKTDSCTIPPHEVRHDTLFIYEYAVGASPISAQVFCPRPRAVLLKDNSVVNLNDFSIDTLDVSMSAGKMYGTFEQSDSPKGVINLSATKNSNIYINQSNMEALNINLDHSELNIQDVSILTLSGFLKNDSKLYSYKSIGKMNIEVDATSRYNLSK